jgi:hypothetical protein
MNEKEEITCKGCQRAFQLLFSHLSRTSCKKAYGEEFEKMKILKTDKRKNYKANWESERRDDRNEKQQKRRNQNRKETNEKQQKRRNQNRKETNEKQKVYRKKRKMNMTMTDRIQAFKRNIIEGPNFACFSCKRALFKRGVKILDINDITNLKSKLKTVFIRKVGLQYRRNQLTLCHNCHNLFKKSKIPRIHYSNGLKLDKVPEELQLKDLEQQLIARLLLFIKIKKLPTSRMKANFDKVISVPIEEDDVSKTISALPRHPDQSKIVAVQLKRKLEMKNTHLQEFIRPAKCIRAVEKLKELGNPFYQDVSVNKDFKLDNEDVKENEVGGIEIKENEVKENEVEENETVLDSVKKYQSRQKNYSCLMPEDPAAQVIVNTESVPISVPRGGSNETVKFAPGEGKSVSPFLQAEHMDVKAFPRHHPSGQFGLNHQREFKLSPSQYFSQRLLNEDERFLRDSFYVFMASSFVERYGLERQINLAGVRGQTVSLAGGMTKVQLHDMYDVFKKIKGTPKYWQVARNELVAKVKQLGPFQVFWIFSCGEMRWSEVFISLLKRRGYKVKIPQDWDGNDNDLLVEGKELWKFVNEDMSDKQHELFDEYTLLIARHFDARVQSFIKDILLGQGHGKVTFSHFSYRVEFQVMPTFINI